MTFTTRCMTGLAGLVLSFGVLAAPLDISGVKVEESIDFRGTPLHLNGAGIRYKAVFKVYVAALYLGKKASTPDEVLTTPGPKRMTFTLLRDIDANELGKAFTRGFEDNTPKSELAKLIPGLIKISQVFSDQKKLQPGDNFTIDWVPGTGTVLSIKGRQQGEPIREIEFFNALTRIWLGPKPADWKLKDDLLGKAP